MPMSELIFDRASTDVTYATNLKNKILTNGFNSLTNAEKQEWFACTLKGAYNYTDRNRVERIVEEINTKLVEYGYMSSLLTIEKERDITTIDDKTSVTRYLSNIQSLITNFYTLQTTPTLPSSLDDIDVTKANNIEKILFDIYTILTGVENDFIHSGVGNAGQTRFWQQGFRHDVKMTEIEYLQGTGTQYIDTGIKPNQNTKVEIGVEILGTGVQRIFGVSATSYVYYVGQQSSGDKLFFAFNRVITSSEYRAVSSISGYNTGYHDLVVDDKEFFVDDVSCGSPTANGYTQQNNAYLFNVYGNTSSCANCKLYYCKIYDNGVLVRDFVPALQNDSVPCLYDKVEKKFYFNKGTGTFVIPQ